MSRGYQYVKKYSLYAFIFLVVVGLVYAPYGLYKEKMEEMNIKYSDVQEKLIEAQGEIRLLKQEHRPILTIDTAFKEGTAAVDTNRQLTSFTLKVNFINLGDRAAYQTQVRAFGSPLFEPDKIYVYPDLYLYNPIYAGTDSYAEVDYIGNYSIQNDKGLVLLYFHLKYSDKAENGDWHEDEYWYTPTFGFTDKKYSMQQIINLNQWINFYRPYVDKILSGQPKDR